MKRGRWSLWNAEAPFKRLRSPVVPFTVIFRFIAFIAVVIAEIILSVNFICGSP